MQSENVKKLKRKIGLPDGELLGFKSDTVYRKLFEQEPSLLDLTLPRFGYLCDIVHVDESTVTFRWAFGHSCFSIPLAKFMDESIRNEYFEFHNLLPME